MMRLARVHSVGALLWVFTVCATADDADDETSPPGVATQPSLNAAQQRAAALRVAHAVAAQAPQQIRALGLVLDATALVADDRQLAVANVAAHSASAELERLRGLYNGGAGASLRMLESADTERAKSAADARLAAARFAQRWGPIQALKAAARHALIEACADGRTLLVRGEVPGRHSWGELPATALLEVDGIEIPGRVLGALRVSSELQSAALLIAVDHAPIGIGAGARVPLSLIAGERSGVVLPRDAVFYDEQGAYVYKQLAANTGDEAPRYVPVKITLLEPYGAGWLASGIDADDDIVVYGAGVLWSLQGVGAHAVDDDD
jgi:hypothetical protein